MMPIVRDRFSHRHRFPAEVFAHGVLPIQIGGRLKRQAYIGYGKRALI